MAIPKYSIPPIYNNKFVDNYGLLKNLRTVPSYITVLSVSLLKTMEWVLINTSLYSSFYIAWKVK